MASNATGDDVQELADLHIDELGRELLAVPGSDPDEEDLIEPERGNDTEAIWVVVDKRGAIGEHRVVDRVPVAAELGGDLVHAPCVAADLLGDPAPGPVGHRHPWSTDASVLLGPRSRGTEVIWTAPPALVPDEACRPPETRQVDQRDDRPVLHRRADAAGLAEDFRNPALDVDAQFNTALVLDPEHVYFGKTHQQLTHARSIGFHRDSPVCWR
jgi:hypothetical protein